MNLKNHSFLVGIDLGTTSIKAVLLSSKGEVIGSTGEEYVLEYGLNETCELDPEIYWEVTCRVLRSLVLKTGIDSAKITGLAFSSQGETIILVDSKGKALRKAIVWLDNRSEIEAKKIEEKFGNQLIMDITGQPEVLPIWPATRILWLRKNEPSIFKRVRKYLLVEDYLIFRMTGKYYTEYSLVSSTLYFDIKNKIWWDEMLDFLGIDNNQLPNLAPSGTLVSHLTIEAALATGLASYVSVVTGSYDHPAGALGAGNIESGMNTLTIGASMAMCVTIDKPINSLSDRLSCQCHTIPGKYFLLPYGQTAGLLLKWFKDVFCKKEIELSEQTDTNVYDLLTSYAENIPSGAEGLIVLPHFMGAGSPYFNQNVKGVFAGMTVGMGIGHFVRAILESIAALVNHNLESLKMQGVNVKEIRFLGGGAKSELWSQILANMTNKPVLTMASSENAALGAALIAGVGSGIFKDIRSAGKRCIKVDKKFLPESDALNVYRETYNNYILLYRTLEKYWILSKKNIGENLNVGDYE
jgi:xylulokinase